jgi:translation initiation factor 3 subunit K
LTNDQVVNNILVKALTTLPEPDFNLCLYLLNEQMVAEEPVVRLIALQDLIEQARFADFWKVYEADDIYKELTAEVLGFEDSIRASMFLFSRDLFFLVWGAIRRRLLGFNGPAPDLTRHFLRLTNILSDPLVPYTILPLVIDIAGAVAMTFQSIETDNLGAYLHLKGQALSDFIKAQGWTESNGVVAIPVNKDNEAKTTVLTENIKFERA